MTNAVRPDFDTHLSLGEVGVDQVFGNMIRAGRRWVDWTQKKLAVEAGVGLSTIINFENGRAIPRAHTITKMQAALRKAGVILIPGGVRDARPGEGAG
jgi:transcriptional regulator with XRE-family HTH domain